MKRSMLGALFLVSASLVGCGPADEVVVIEPPPPKVKEAPPPVEPGGESNKEQGTAGSKETGQRAPGLRPAPPLGADPVVPIAAPAVPAKPIRSVMCSASYRAAIDGPWTAQANVCRVIVDGIAHSCVSANAGEGGCHIELKDGTTMASTFEWPEPIAGDLPDDLACTRDVATIGAATTGHLTFAASYICAPKVANAVAPARTQIRCQPTASVLAIDPARAGSTFGSSVALSTCTVEVNGAIRTCAVQQDGCMIPVNGPAVVRAVAHARVVQDGLQRTTQIGGCIGDAGTTLHAEGVTSRETCANDSGLVLDVDGGSLASVPANVVWSAYPSAGNCALVSARFVAGAAANVYRSDGLVNVQGKTGSILTPALPAGPTTFLLTCTKPDGSVAQAIKTVVAR